MKNPTTKLVLLLTVFTLVLASCSKEKRIENKLESRTGKWMNTVYRYSSLSSTGNGGPIDGPAYTYWDTGYIVFEKNGTFVWVLNLNGNETMRSGTWENTDKEIVLTEGSDVSHFKIEQKPGNYMRLRCTKKSPPSNDETKITSTYLLDFKKEK